MINTGYPLLDALNALSATFSVHSSKLSATTGFSIVRRKSTGCPSNKGTSNDSK